MQRLSVACARTAKDEALGLEALRYVDQQRIHGPSRAVGRWGTFSCDSRR